jgi:hypothetical protein
LQTACRTFISRRLLPARARLAQVTPSASGEAAHACAMSVREFGACCLLVAGSASCSLPCCARLRAGYTGADQSSCTGMGLLASRSWSNILCVAQRAQSVPSKPSLDPRPVLPARRSRPPWVSGHQICSAAFASGEFGAAARPFVASAHRWFSLVCCDARCSGYQGPASGPCRRKTFASLVSSTAQFLLASAAVTLVANSLTSPNTTDEGGVQILSTQKGGDRISFVINGDRAAVSRLALADLTSAVRCRHFISGLHCRGVRTESVAVFVPMQARHNQHCVAARFAPRFLYCLSTHAQCGPCCLQPTRLAPRCYA